MSDTIVIIPTYNERENIERLVSEIFRYAPDVNLIIADDDSPDGTGIIADRIAKDDNRVSVTHSAIRRERSPDGLREALKRQGIRYIIEMDSDFTHDPKYIPIFLEEIKHNDVIIGSRFVKGGSDKERAFLRRGFSIAVNIFIRNYLGLKIKDCTSGYRCFRRSVIFSINPDRLMSNGPAVIEEILYIAYFRGYKIKEIPIILKQRQEGKTKLDFRKLLKVLMDILVFKRTHLQDKKKKEIEEFRKFGFGLALGLNIAGCIMFYRGRGHFIWFTSMGSLNLMLAILCPETLVPMKKVLDKIILWFGRLVNAISLLIVFYLIFTPTALIIRFLKKDILNERLDKTAGSYWIKRKEADFVPEHYERMG